MKNSTCPITGDVATLTRTGEWTEVRCPTCGAFRVSDTALKLAGEQTDILKEALVAAKAQATQGDLPTIDNLSG